MLLHAEEEDLEGDDEDRRYLSVHESGCGCEVKVTQDPKPGEGGNAPPRCCCGMEMKKVSFLEGMIMRNKTGTEYRRVSPGLGKPSTTMKMQEGKMGYLLLWLVGVPIPILLLIFLLRGCN